MQTTTSIAIIDDHTLLRAGLVSLVNDLQGYTVIADCDNGQSFIDIVKQQSIKPQIILLDISMPVMDGFETAAWISEHLPQAKILVLSMLDDEKSIIRMLRLGARGYILKDGEPETLELALHDLAQGEFHFNDLVTNAANNEQYYNSIATDTARLTSKEADFLKYCCTEMAYKEIANAMGVSPRTIDGYRDQLFEKLELKSRVGLVLYAVKHGYFTPAA